MAIESLVTDNPLDADPSETQTLEDKSSDEDTTPPSDEDKGKGTEPFLLNFPDRETAERSFKEEQAKITKVSMENAALRGKLEVFERMKSPDYDVMTSDRQKKLDETLIKRLEEGGSSAVLETIREGLIDVVDLNKKELKALKDEIINLIEERDPIINERKEEIETLMTEYDLTRSKAIKLLKDINTEQSNTSKREEKRAKIPGRTTVTQTGAAATSAPQPLPSGFEQYLNDSGLSEDSVKRIRASLNKSLTQKEG